MKPFFAILIILFCTTIAQIANAQQWSTFDTNGHPKAKGVWAAVKYPSGWEINIFKDNWRPTISVDTVEKFGHYNNYTNVDKTLFVQIMKPHLFESFPDFGAMTEDEIRTMYEQSMIPRGGKHSTNEIAPPMFIVKTVRKIIHENYYGARVGVSGIIGKNGRTYYVEQESMSIVYKIQGGEDRAITLGCSNGSILDNRRAVEQAQYQDTYNLCNTFFGSLTVFNKQ